MIIKSKVRLVESSMTPFWKDERYGYNIYQNKRNLRFWPGSYALNMIQEEIFLRGYNLLDLVHRKKYFQDEKGMFL